MEMKGREVVRTVSLGLVVQSSTLRLGFESRYGQALIRITEVINLVWHK